MNQNYANHRRLHPIFHFFLSFVLLAILIGTVTLVIREGLSLLSVLICLICIYLAVNFTLLRSYPLKAQDRAIKAEENLRHYVLTGKLLDSRLSFAQITALRFAGDTEFPELCNKAAAQNLSSDDIKKAIQHWRADLNRI